MNSRNVSSVPSFHVTVREATESINIVSLVNKYQQLPLPFVKLVLPDAYRRGIAKSLAGDFILNDDCGDEHGVRTYMLQEIGRSGLFIRFQKQNIKMLNRDEITSVLRTPGRNRFHPHDPFLNFTADFMRSVKTQSYVEFINASLTANVEEDGHQFSNIKLDACCPVLRGMIQDLSDREVNYGANGILTSQLLKANNVEFSSFHLEDANLASINVMVRGTGPKIWIGIRNADKLKLDAAIRTQLSMFDAEQNLKRRRLTRTELDTIISTIQHMRLCDSPTSHKDFVLSLDFLHSLGIETYGTVQWPGEMVVTWGFHGVGNAGENVTEAVNFKDRLYSDRTLQICPLRLQDELLDSLIKLQPMFPYVNPTNKDLVQRAAKAHHAAAIRGKRNEEDPATKAARMRRCRSLNAHSLRYRLAKWVRDSILDNALTHRRIEALLFIDGAKELLRRRLMANVSESTAGQIKAAQEALDSMRDDSGHPFKVLSEVIMPFVCTNDAHTFRDCCNSNMIRRLAEWAPEVFESEITLNAFITKRSEDPNYSSLNLKAK